MDEVEMLEEVNDSILERDRSIEIYVCIPEDDSITIICVLFGNEDKSISGLTS
jgi:hypothetical protein